MRKQKCSCCGRELMECMVDNKIVVFCSVCDLEMERNEST